MMLSVASVSSFVFFPIDENPVSLRDRYLIASRDILEIDLSQPDFSSTTPHLCDVMESDWYVQLSNLIITIPNDVNKTPLLKYVINIYEFLFIKWQKCRVRR